MDDKAGKTLQQNLKSSRLKLERKSKEEEFREKGMHIGFVMLYDVHTVWLRMQA